MPAQSSELETRLERSWRANADAWTDAVRGHGIASRRAGTDAAVIDAIRATPGRRVLDVGCGEGWLARTLTAEGREVVGIDSSPELIARANALGGARFEILSYGGLAAGAAELGRFDIAVCNYSLLGADLQTPLRALRGLLGDDGVLIVQTVHPWIACGDAPYVAGWREETFAGFGSGFSESMPWYFRTLASWGEELSAAGFTARRWIEPFDAATGKPLSLLIGAHAL